MALVLLGFGGDSLWSQDWKLLGTVALDVYGDETVVNVKWICAGTLDQPVLLESREGGNTEIREVRHILGNFLLLKGRLESAYQTGSKIYQAPQHVDCQVPQVAKEMQAPVVACDPPSLRLVRGRSVTLRPRAGDPNDDPLTFAWTVDGQAVNSAQPFLEFETATRATGSYRVSVVATDSDGMSSGCDFNVAVDETANQDPTVALTLDQSQTYVGRPVTATAQGSDPDGDPLVYSWTVDDRESAGASSRMQIDTGAMAGGRHSVSVTVRDDRDGSATDVASFSLSERIVIQMDGIEPDNLAKARLDEIALRMQQDTRLQVLIAGHTDDRGSEEVNQRVGQQRADGVASYLVSEHNIDASRIQTRSASESQPVGDNQTEEGQRQNRRVEIELTVP